MKKSLYQEKKPSLQIWWKRCLPLREAKSSIRSINRKSSNQIRNREKKLKNKWEDNGEKSLNLVGNWGKKLTKKND